jgi:colanic acid biosynthesis glycosyl transferase WcaI
VRVLMLSPAFPPEITGSGNLYYELATSLVAAGHEVTVITAQPRQRLGEQRLDGRRRRLLERLVVDGVDVRRPATLSLPLDRAFSKGLDHFSLAASYLAAGVGARRPDVVLAYSPPLTFGVTAAWLARRHGVPMVFNAQDMFPQYAVDTGLLTSAALIRMFRAMERYVYRRAAAIAVHSDGNRRFLIGRGVPAEKIHVIANWADTDRITPQPRHNDFRREHGLGTRFLVSYAGTMGWAQGLDGVIEAARLLRDVPNVLLLMVGDGPRRRALEAASAGLPNVRFLPLQPPDRYLALLAASDTCLISLNGRLTTPVVPGKLFDIMAAGRAVIASVPADGDAAQIVWGAECGLVVDPASPGALADAIRTLAGAPERLEVLGKNGRFQAEMRYSRPVSVSAYERLLTRASGTRSARAHV